MIQWGEKYALGLPKVDQQHQVLVMLINRLESLQAAGGPSGRDLEEILKHLDQYVRTHFSEERMLERLGFDEAPEHLAEHRAFEDRLAELRAEYLAGDAHVLEHLSTFLGGWLTHHILENDRRYVDSFRERDLLEQAAKL